jgi:carbon-monoxide dehydrogenase small subunit
MQVTLQLNGVPTTVSAAADQTLADFLRDDLGLTGTHVGCNTGSCGSCAVLLDGEPVRSCLLLAVQADGAAVETIEGLAHGGQLHPLQRAFAALGAVQCGFCTTGMIMTARALLDANPKPSEAEIREAIEGNLCRCTGFVKIVGAIQAASAPDVGSAAPAAR